MTEKFDYASGTNAAFIEAEYESYLKDPNAVDPTFRHFFDGYEFAVSSSKATSKERASSTNKHLEGHDHALIEAYINAIRRLGHLSAHLNPLAPKPELETSLREANHGLDKIDPHKSFEPTNFGKGSMSKKEIISKLMRTYCGSIGADFRDINSIEEITWLQNQMEPVDNKPKQTLEQKKRILTKLAFSEGFEKFLQARYLGQKRFSVEGLESLIPLLDTIINEAAEKGVVEINMGMAHRGRLNVLANILEKPFERMLLEFEGSEFNPFDIDGDVKYHMGYGNEVDTANGKKMRLYLSPNPSHLEAVNPVVEGFARCRQDLNGNPSAIMPVLLHGDASFIGQGIVCESLNLSKLEGYHTAGTIHVITNNQIGFTTDPSESRSCQYSSDIAKMLRAPVFHVNADDPEAVVWVSKLAVMYRQKFKKDFVIDLIGYRRHGHNETDEPNFTQPLMYKIISKHPTSYQKYAKHLIESNQISEVEFKELTKEVKARLQSAYEAIKKSKPKTNFSPPKELTKVFQYKKTDRSQLLAKINTAISAERFEEICNSITNIPDGFEAHSKIKRILKTRSEMKTADGAFDWAMAELLAYASLSREGYPIRLTGQDSRRGTFSHRHAVITDTKSASKHNLLADLGAKVEIHNSPLSEAGCLGFEFGYSVANPDALVLWEAQFGDFANGAQIIIDQFLSASEAKWKQCSGLVMLLPHGYEGMGPEHSSARPERFLQACGNLNMQVANVTTPAQFFHLLRRQIIRGFRKPLIVMTPKSLLRHPKVISPSSSFTAGQFEEVLLDESKPKYTQTKRVLMCSGKIYYELLDFKEKKCPNPDEVAIIRFEQLYPYPKEHFDPIMKKFKKADTFIWVQEEPQNMGSWTFIEPRLRQSIPQSATIQYVGRKPSGSTAEGSGKSHQLEQQRIIEEAYNTACGWEPKVVKG